LATARGLGLASGKPVVGMSTLDAIARSASNAEPTLVVLDARRDEVYASLYDADHVQMSPPELLTIGAAAKAAIAADAVLYGSGAPLVAEHMSPGSARISGLTAFPDIAHVAALAALLPLSSEPPKPLYLRAPDAKPQTRGVAERAAPFADPISNTVGQTR
jgi:tRNA threonylcarbamoyladenosine biosynthesis protein TsaB